MRLLARLCSAAFAAGLLTIVTDPALACSCDKEARIKKYGTLRLVHEAEPPAPTVPATPPPAPSTPASSTPGS